MGGAFTYEVRKILKPLHLLVTVTITQPISAVIPLFPPPVWTSYVNVPSFLPIAQTLCGAGGGGFMAVITKKRGARSEVEDLLAKNRMEGCTVHEVQISREGLAVTKGDLPVKIHP